MKIEIDVLNPKSIKAAQQKLQNIQKKIQTSMLQDILKESVEWIKQRANYYVQMTDLGENVIKGIQASWETETIGSTQIILKNTFEKAVYVEFGVGVVGQQNPHENAATAGYQYNIGDKIDENGRWRFYTNRADLDLPQSAIYSTTLGKDKRQRMSIYTAGTKGTMYAYNAVVDLKEYGLKEVAEKIYEKYWR